MRASAPACAPLRVRVPLLVKLRGDEWGRVQCGPRTDARGRCGEAWLWSVSLSPHSDTCHPQGLRQLPFHQGAHLFLVTQDCSRTSLSFYPRWTDETLSQAVWWLGSPPLKSSVFEIVTRVSEIKHSYPSEKAGRQSSPPTAVHVPPQT